MPRPVFDATVAAAREVERDPLIAAYGPGKTRLDGVRRKAAELLGCTMEEIVLTGSTTAGMNMVAEGLRLSPGDRVLTTDQEHHGGELCWRWLERRAGVKVDMVTVPPGEADPEGHRRPLSPGNHARDQGRLLLAHPLLDRAADAGRRDLRARPRARMPDGRSTALRRLAPRRST